MDLGERKSDLMRPVLENIFQKREQIFAQGKVKTAVLSTGTAWIHLNRPTSLNALDMEMAQALTTCLLSWKDDHQIKRVVISGEGRAFCAGGDIRAFYHAKVGNAPQSRQIIEDYFRAEYSLNTLIAEYPKPYVSLLHGINMGGGMGISMPGSHRVLHPEATLAMPEVSIGFFPDAGATHFLQKCPGLIGRYLSLSGRTINAADGMYARLGTHFVTAEQWDDFLMALSQTEDHEQTLAQFSASPPQSQLAEKHSQIDALFQGDDLAEILTRCEDTIDSWSQAVSRTLLSRSPLSLFVTFSHQQRSQNHAFRECMALEFSLSQHFVEGHDFTEGVRACLIDKDQKPQWSPRHWREVRPAQYESYLTNKHKLF
ncbi:enoyl-CoA hydratase/isomerase family protein [Alphaproteobacteria bacterium]|nr:enoyl-CoA hydratase/isomerase family protein [Alphaproteobacteria bacterium]